MNQDLKIDEASDSEMQSEDEAPDEFINPLKLKGTDISNTKTEDEDGFGSDAELPEGVVTEPKKKRRDQKAERKAFEEVRAEAHYSDMDSDDVAETRALAKVML